MASEFATSFETAQTRRKGMMEQQHTSIALEETAVQELASRMRGESCFVPGMLTMSRLFGSTTA
jgi:hypothetical protein